MRQGLVKGVAVAFLAFWKIINFLYQKSFSTSFILWSVSSDSWKTVYFNGSYLWSEIHVNSRFPLMTGHAYSGMMLAVSEYCPTGWYSRTCCMRRWGKTENREIHEVCASARINHRPVYGMDVGSNCGFVVSETWCTTGKWVYGIDVGSNCGFVGDMWGKKWKYAHIVRRQMV